MIVFSHEHTALTCISEARISPSCFMLPLRTTRPHQTTTTRHFLPLMWLFYPIFFESASIIESFFISKSRKTLVLSFFSPSFLCSFLSHTKKRATYCDSFPFLLHKTGIFNAAVKRYHDRNLFQDLLQNPSQNPLPQTCFPMPPPCPHL